MEEQREAKQRFLVCCKCGHVGKAWFIRQVYPIYARDAKEAARLARKRPGVKHDHPDAVLWVKPANIEEYYKAREALKSDVYWQGAKLNLAMLADRLEPEPNYVPEAKRNGRKFSKRHNKTESREYRKTKTRVLESEISDYITEVVTD